LLSIPLAPARRRGGGCFETGRSLALVFDGREVHDSRVNFAMNG
jgi:hypothetical protein